LIDLGCQFRVRPEDITLNIGDNVPIPVPNMPGKWKAIIHDNTVTWLANWTENINGNHKYVFLAAGSSLKGQSDMLKFEKARELKVSRFGDDLGPSYLSCHRIMSIVFARITRWI
jgi:DNA topoisomerase-1